MTRIEPRLQVDISAHVGRHPVAAFNVDQTGALYFLCTGRKPDLYLRVPSHALFPKVVPAEPQDYRLLCLREGRLVHDFAINEMPINFNHVQPLLDGFLLACSRSYYRAKQDFDLNAHVFNASSERLRAFLLGDGIHDLQVTPAGVIWTSYFDEGIGGNLGWKTPIGQAGLVRWNASGKKTYEFTPPPGLGPIAECYALNVESDAVTWCYYGYDFSLVRIRNSVADAYWKVPISRSPAFAVQGRYVLFIGPDNDRYVLYVMDDGQALRVAREFRVTKYFPRRFDRIIGRGDSIWLQRGPRVYRISIDDALAVGSSP